MELRLARRSSLGEQEGLLRLHSREGPGWCPWLQLELES